MNPHHVDLRPYCPRSELGAVDCGWHIHPGDVTGLTSLLEHLNANRKLIHEAGHRARQAFLEHYDRPIGVARIAAVVPQASASEPGT